MAIQLVWQAMCSVSGAMPFTVYVIRLTNAVLAEKKFAKRNPGRRTVNHVCMSVRPFIALNTDTSSTSPVNTRAISSKDTTMAFTAG